jgi:hypothetical protein
LVQVQQGVPYGCSSVVRAVVLYAIGRRFKSCLPYHQQQTKEKMSYHDQPPGYMRSGIGVVNPLIRIENKLKKVQEVLDNISDASILTANDLKTKLQKVLDD